MLHVMKSYILLFSYTSFLIEVNPGIFSRVHNLPRSKVSP